VRRAGRERGEEGHPSSFLPSFLPSSFLPLCRCGCGTQTQRLVSTSYRVILNGFPRSVSFPPGRLPRAVKTRLCGCGWRRRSRGGVVDGGERRKEVNGRR
jgi:hypothetical protein